MSDLASDGAVGLVRDDEAGAVGYEGFLLPQPARARRKQLSDQLQGARGPNIDIFHEKPEHRFVLLLKLKGFSNREIAHEMGYTEAWVSQICRQPWFQEMLVDKMAEAGDQILDRLIVQEGKNSLFKLVELRDTAESESVQKDCAIRILDQCVGKAVQRSENLNIDLTKADKVINRADELDQRIEDLERQIREQSV